MSMQAVGTDPNFPYQSRKHTTDESQSSDPLTLTKSVVRFLQRLAERLDPPRLYLRTSFKNIALGAQIAQVQPKAEFNGLLVSLVTGQVNINFGTGSDPSGLVNLAADFTFIGPMGSPVFLPFPKRVDPVVTMWNDAAGPATATGTIVLINY